MLLERDTELAELRAGMEGLSDKQSGFFAVVGPTGAGKTRLLSEARHLAGRSSVRVLTARALELEREYAYGVVRQLFEPSLASADDQQLATWLTGAASAATTVLGDVTSSEVSPGGFAELNGFFWLLSNMCQTGPLAVIIDDLHWADEPSLRFLAFLLPRLGDLTLLIAVGLRTAEPGVATHLLDVIATDPVWRILRPAPLTAAGAGTLLSSILPQPADPPFAQACHRLTGGNPLLLNELASALAAEHTEPTRFSIGRMEELGSQALSRRVSLELGRLTSGHVRLAQAIAVLSPDADLDRITQLAGLPCGDAQEPLRDLQDAALIQPTKRSGRYDFKHPLMRAAVYEQIDYVRRNAYHRRAAALLLDTPDVPAERAAAHLLRLEPVGDLATVGALRQAADEALQHNAPEAASRYLQRALAEPPPAEDKLALLIEAGNAALPVDLKAATGYLQDALALTKNPQQRAQLGVTLGLAMQYMQRVEEATEILTKTVEELPEEEDDLRRAVEAILLNVSCIAADWQSVTLRLPRLRDLPPAQTLGALQLDCMIAALDSYSGNPRATERARRALQSPLLLESASQRATIAMAGCFALTIADPDAGIAAHDDLIARARVRGAPSALCPAHTYRGLGYLRRGNLAQAEEDLREALRLAELTGNLLAIPIIHGILAEVLVDEGRISEAEFVLESSLPEPLPAVGLYFFPLHSRARLLHAQGHQSQALQAAFAAGQRFVDHGGGNPAIVPWRSQAALCLHSLGRDQEARDYAREEISIARRCGIPHALGHALRIAGILTPGAPGLRLLREAVDILQTSSARLEHAHALIDLGAALRRGNARAEARTPLSAGLDLAEHCGAALLAETARNELCAAGASPRTTAITGLNALTPSERRVAELAAHGLTNRQIAQELFVTAKTVEVHLSATYRKLHITTRTKLRQAFTDSLSSVKSTDATPNSLAPGLPSSPTYPT